MSLTGSLMTYDNNNDLMNNSQEKMISNPKKSTTVSQGIGQKQPLVAVSTQTGAPGSRKRKSNGCCGGTHLNSLWSLWYGLLAVLGQSYILIQSIRRFLGYSVLEWPGGAGAPSEMLWCWVLLGGAALLLPPFLAAAAFRAGNLPNDGFKLGAALSTCSHGPPSSLPGAGAGAGRKNTGVLRSLWQHGGPTAPFLHLVTAFCLLLPRLLMEARLIESGFLPQDAIWRTDLDFMVANRDRLVVLSFMTSTNNHNISTLPTPLPMVTSPPTSPRTSSILTTLASITEYPTITETFTTFPPPTTIAATVTETVLAKTTNTKYISPTIAPKRQNSRNKGPRTSTTVTSSSSSTMGSFSEVDRNSSKFQPKSLPFSMENSLRDILGSEPWDPSESQSRWRGVSLEFLNYAIALLVYAVRYPAVFWSTNKCFGLIFSFQLLVNGVQSLMSFAGMSVLYKVQVYGVDRALPLLRHRAGVNFFGGESPFLLNPHVTLALFVLSGLLVLSSSLVLYLYGYGRFNAFLNTEREKRVIMVREGRAASGWGYFTHCAALCVLLAIAVCCAPLLHDYTVVYRGSLDSSVLVCVVSTILHLFLWVLVWLFLTVKQKWVFKLRVTIGKAAVRSARSIKLVTDVDLIGNCRDDDLTAQPLLVVGNGRTYTISENSPKKAIMTVIQKSSMEKKSKASGSIGSDDGDGEEQIYWLRPKTVSLNPSDSTDKLAWFNKKLTSTNPSGKPGQKVTFNDVPCTSNSRNKERGASLRIGEGDDGDYATLRELPLHLGGGGGVGGGGDPGDDTSEEGKLLACVRDDSVTYACTNRDLIPPCDYEDPSPLLTPEALPDPPVECNSQVSPVTTSSNCTVTVHTECQSSSGNTPRCLRRADSGVPGEEPHRSGSGSSGSSPPDPPGSSTSESSSGVHSSTSLPNQRPRANSLDDFVLDHQPKDENRLKSFSLQRGAIPPTFHTNKTDSSQSVYGFSGIHYTTIIHPINSHLSENGLPSQITENGLDSVIIRRKSMQPKAKVIVNTPPVISEEPFGRSTNMKMTTFTNSKESLRNIVASSATLPHYPTQPMDMVTPHCSTMPLALEARGVMMPPPMVSGSSCQSFARPHCTLPTHQGGLRLVGAVQAIRRPPVNPRGNSSHHTFPVHLIQPTQFGMQNHLLRDIERDSANFSMASSGDSDNNMYMNANRA